MNPATGISVQTESFDAGVETQALAASSAGVGAVVSFLGLVRDLNLGETVTGLELEHYPGMTERSIGAIVDEARQRWPLLAVRVIHRVGRLEIGDAIVFVGAASAHRSDAFEACDFIMDYLKTRAPFWKKETIGDRSRWIDARASDDSAALRWE